MVRRDGAFVKTQRIKQIVREIARQPPGPVSLDRMVTWVEVNIGLSTRRALEYIEKACLAQGWLVTNGEIMRSLEAEQ